MTYKCLEEHLELGRAQQFDEYIEVGVQVQIEREQREAETNVAQDITDIQSEDVVKV